MAPKVKKKVLIIGLDGATWDLLKPWAEAGELPLFKKLMEKGTYGILKSTVPCRTCPAIPALYTGKNPGKLGVFDFTKADGSLVTFNDIKEPAIWDILGEQGYKSAIIALRTTYPPKRLNGIMISGRCPSEESPYTYPRELKERVKGFHSAAEEFNKSKAPFIKNVFNFVIEDIQRKYSLSRQFLFADYDFTMYWIGATDFAQHFLWHQKDKLLEVYHEVEKMLAEIIANFSGDLFIVSDHGFGTAPATSLYINTWLKNEGYLKLKGSRIQQWLVCQFTPSVNQLPERLQTLLLNAARRIFLREKRGKANATEPNKEAQASPLRPFSPLLLLLDLKTTIAYSDRFWGVWICNRNLERNYEAVREEIIERLKDLRDSKGKKIIVDAMKREEAFNGKYLDQIPDIVFLTSKEISVSRWISNSLFRKSKKTDLKGAHDTTRDGILLAYGPDIKEGVKLGEADITDIVPTILHLFGLPVPEDMDGKVLKDIFKEESEIAQRPIVYQKPKWAEERRIRERISKLKLREMV